MTKNQTPNVLHSHSLHHPTAPITTTTQNNILSDFAQPPNSVPIMSPGGGSWWADLPRELLEAIAIRLDTRIELLPFRSVCNSWRSSVPSPDFDQPTPPVSVRIPYPVAIDGVLARSTICNFQFQPLNQASSVTPSSSSSNPPPSKGWLIEIQESPRGKLLISNPLSYHKLRYSSIQLNLLDARLLQLSTSFRLKLTSGLPSLEINKVVLFRPSAPQFIVLAIYHHGKLGYWRSGDERWTLLDDKNFEYDDIIPYRRQFYVVDRWGTVSLIDSSLRIIQYAPPLYGCGGQKNLVECGGDLYVVDRYLDGERKTWKDAENAVNNHVNAVHVGRRQRLGKSNPRAIDFRVYKLDEEWGTWVDVKSLGDRVFILTPESSFSTSAAQFVAGGEGNCIYFTDGDDYSARGLSPAEIIRVFQLGDRSIEKLGLLSPHFDILNPFPSASSPV